jgi:DeoR/GlpR family transcriptional regulator of sugar metabolism
VTEVYSKRVEIIPAKRRAMILDRVRANGAASIQELADEIGASASTIRRDLEHLTEGGYLERTHGGALLVAPLQATFEREPSINAHLRRDQKRAIGAAAALRLNPRESVVFDSSSTVLEAVRAAAARDISLTAVTNSLDIAFVCASVPSWRVIMPGGSIRPGSGILVGEPGESFLKTIHADVCLIGAYAVTGRLLTDASLEIVAIKHAMIQSARRTILLVDSSKFQAPAFCTFADLSAVDEVITDDGAAPEDLAMLRSFNVKVSVVPTMPAESEAATVNP